MIKNINKTHTRRFSFESVKMTQQNKSKISTDIMQKLTLPSRIAGVSGFRNLLQNPPLKFNKLHYKLKNKVERPTTKTSSDLTFFNYSELAFLQQSLKKSYPFLAKKNHRKHFSWKEKYFIWKNSKNLSSIKRAMFLRQIHPSRLNFNRPLYKQLTKRFKKPQNKIRRIKQNKIQILQRLRTRRYYYKLQPYSNQRRNWRRRVIQKKYKKPHFTLFSWYERHIGYNSKKQHVVQNSEFRKQLFNLKKSNDFSLVKKPVFDLKMKNSQRLVSFVKWINAHQIFYKNISKWTGILKLFPLYLLILLKKWKISQNFKNKALYSKRLTWKILSHIQHNTLVQLRCTTDAKLYSRKLFSLNKLFKNIRPVKSEKGVVDYKLQSDLAKQLRKTLTIGLTSQRSLSSHMLSNILNFKRIYRQQYKASLIEQTQYILENKYRDFTRKSPEKFLRGPRIQRLKYPWLPQMISKKRAYSLQYFNFYRSLRTPWARKRNKIYRTFMSITKHKHEKVKLKLGMRGGNRSIHFKLNLLKVILPFYGKLNQRQFKRIWHSYKYIKSHYQGRAEQFNSKLNTTLCLLIQQLGWSPNTYWAQNSIKNGWISVSKTNDSTKWKNSPSQELFPLLKNLNTTEKQNCQMNSIKNPFYHVKLNEVIQIHPHIKIFTKQFFLRRLNWNRRHLPNFIETDSSGANAIIINTALYYQANLKDRNKRNFLRYILN